MEAKHTLVAKHAWLPEEEEGEVLEEEAVQQSVGATW
jgi:DNA-directed RNA polymerase subunit H (RpoH/RPB5)